MGEIVLLPGRCESCGAVAFVRLHDGSVWCMGCHTAALRYDDDLGTEAD